MIPQKELIERVGLIEAGLVKGLEDVSITRMASGNGWVFYKRGTSHNNSAILERGPMSAHEQFKVSCFLCFGAYDPSMKPASLPKAEYIYQTTYTDGNGY